MTNLKARLAALERRHKPVSDHWRLPILEQAAGQDIDAQLDELHSRAVASGWKGPGPFVIVAIEPDVCAQILEGVTVAI